MPRATTQPSHRTRTSARKTSRQGARPRHPITAIPTGDPRTHMILPARRSLGLTAPRRAEREALWDMVKVPSAGIQDGYVPLIPAAEMHYHPARFKCVAGAARVGKSLMAGMEAFIWTPHADLIWIVGPDYDQARPEFLYTMEGLLSLDLVHPQSISLPSTAYLPCALETKWGCVVQTKTASDIEKLAAVAPDIIIACEPGQMPTGVLFRFYERLVTRRGMLLMIGTFEESHPWYTDVWLRWREWPNAEGGKSFSVPMWANSYTFPGGRQDPEILRLERSITDKAHFLSRVAGVPATSYQLVFGRVWKPRLPNGTPHHVRHLPFRRWDLSGGGKVMRPVELAVDPGYSPSKYAVAVMQWDDEGTYQVDEVVMEGAQHGQVIQECMRRPWWPNVQAIIMDPFAATSHVFGGASPAEVWYNETKILPYVPPRFSVEDAIERHASFLWDPFTEEPRHFVNEDCTHTIWEYNHWRRAQDKGQGNVRTRPVDRNCDILKAKSAWFVYHYQTRGVAADQSVPQVSDLSFVGVR